MKEVQIDPPNIRTNPIKKGPALDKVLFAKPTYNCLGDLHKPAIREIFRVEDREIQIAAGNEKRFKSQSRVKERYYRAAYEHKTDYTHIQKNFRSEENPREVISDPPNIKTNPIKKGQHGRQVYFGGTVPYMCDDYNRPKEFLKAERDYHLSMVQEKPFSQRVRKKDTFNSHREILSEKVPLPHRKPKP